MVHFDEESHTYSDENGPARSVTQILKEVGIGGAYDGIPAHVLENKARLGTNVHKLTHYWDENDLDETQVDPKCKGYLDAWIAFRNDTGFMPRLIEQLYIVKVDAGLHQMRYGMTLDREGDLDGEPTIIDLKCSVNEQRLSWAVQVAGYELGQRSMDGVKRKKAIVQLKPNGKYKLFRYNNENYNAVWMSALILSTAKGIL
jgi:hypothetical protein